MSLRRLVYVTATITLLILVVTAGLTYNSYSQANDSSTEIVTKLEPAATSASTLLLGTADMERGVRAYVSTQRAGELAPYAEGAAASEQAIADIENLLSGTDPALEQQVDEVAQARTEWINTVATPCINLVRANKVAQAETLLYSQQSRRTFELLRARATAVNTMIDQRVHVQFEDFQRFANQLGAVLVGSWVLFVLGAVAIIVMLFRSVLRPLKSLGSQMNRVAGDGGYGGDKETPIRPSGPPELAEVGRDAEDMRRRLVKEIEEAEQLNKSLGKQNPLVASIRSELTRPSRVPAVGLDIYGEMEPSETVLAGDWWDAVALPGGRTAVVLTDISGHGPEAAFYGLCLKLLITGTLEAGGSLVSAFERGVRIFADTPGRFATAVGIVIDTNSRTVEWVNAGHLPPMVIDRNGEFRELSTSGLLLSTLGGGWASSTTELDSSDLIVMWTDGITESRDESGNELEASGLRRLIANARSHGRGTPEQIVRSVLADGRSRAVNWGSDDRTLIIAGFTNSHS